MVETINGQEIKIITSFELKEKIKNEPQINVHFSGLKMLDTLTGGFNAGQVVAVTGFTKCGKTSFCQTLTSNYSMSGHGCLWFSYEMSNLEFIRKYGDNVPLYTLPEELQSTSIEWIEKAIIKAKEKHLVDFVFIDHLHYLVPMTGHQNLSTLIGYAMRGLKKLSIKHSLVVFILAHTGQPKSDPKHSLDLSDIRDSSFVAQESDFVLGISRPPLSEVDSTVNTDTSAKLRILANRRTGHRGIINLDYSSGFYKEVM